MHSLVSELRPLVLATTLVACGGAIAPGTSFGDAGDGFPRDAGLLHDGASDASVHATDSGASSDDDDASAWSDASSIVDDSHPVASCVQIDARHTGAIDEPALAGPLERLWDVDLGGLPSYPIIARGLVYLTAKSAVVALDTKTGARVWGPVDLGQGDGEPFLPTYEAGRLFVLTWEGVLWAFDAATGTKLWTTTVHPEQMAFFDSPPTADRGAVFVSGCGSIVGVDQLTGAIMWEQSPPGTSSAPVPVGNDLFASYACGVSESFNRFSGAKSWEHSSTCSGGGAFTPAFFNGAVYTPDDSGGFDVNTILLDPKTGNVLGHAFDTIRSMPAFHGTQGFFASNDKGLHAEDLTAHSTTWTFGGNGGPIVMTSPIVAGGRVFIGTIDGNGGATVRALDEHSGAEVWSDDVSADLGANEDFGSYMAFAAAEGVLVVPAENHVVAYGAAAVHGDQ